MALLPNVAYIFNVFATKISVKFFTKLEKAITKFIWMHMILKCLTAIAILSLLDFKLYYIAIVTRKSHVDQWNI